MFLKQSVREQYKIILAENETENEKLQNEINRLCAEISLIKEEMRVLKKEKGVYCFLKIFKILSI